MSESEYHEPPPQLILDDKFMGVKEPMWELPREQPWHRAAAWMFGEGATRKEVAQILGKSEPAVQNLFRQTWFQKQLSTIMQEKGNKDGVMERLRGEMFNSVETLVDLRDNPKVSSATRLASATQILDRTMGKPVQRIEATQMATSEDPCAEAERLEQEVIRMHRDNGATVIAAGETGGGVTGNGHQEAHNA
jgi:predicted transcriptional regulator